MLQTNEVLALLFTLLAAAATVVVRAHPANTPRTREWWGRFLALVGLVLLAQVATNLEEVLPAEAPALWLNLLEHVSLAGAGAWALALSVRGLAERYARRAETGGGEA